MNSLSGGDIPHVLHKTSEVNEPCFTELNDTIEPDTVGVAPPLGPWA